VSRRAAGNPTTRKLINHALQYLRVAHDRRTNPGIAELEKAEKRLYGSSSTSDDVLGRWNQVLTASQMQEKWKRHPLNASRSYLRAANRYLSCGDLAKARTYLRCARILHDRMDRGDFSEDPATFD
jgi:hypothetical protein